MRRAFTLIELMIVVAIIAIIAAISIPNLLQSRIQANEATAVATLRSYIAAQTTWKEARYDSTSDTVASGSYTDAFSVLVERNLMTQPIANAVDANNPANGYYYDEGDAGGLNWSFDFQLYALPAGYGRSGNNSFYVNAAGVVRYSDQGGTTAAAGGTGWEPY